MKHTIMYTSIMMILLCCSCVNGYSSTTLFADEPSIVGDTEIFTSDTTIIINASDEVSYSGLNVIGKDDAPIVVNITIEGVLNLTGPVNCTHATLTVTNNGTLYMDTTMIYITGNSTLSISNQGTWMLQDVNMQVYGGLLYLSNSGTMTGNNLYFKDQYDGTFIHNEGEAILQDISLVANGAMGAFHLTNKGNMSLIRTLWDVNYGGTIDLNSMYGDLTVTNGSIDISGESHGKQSTVNILDGNTTWEYCTCVINRGAMDYATSGIVYMKNFTIHTLLNGSFLLSNSGMLVYSDGLMENAGYVNIHNHESFTILNSVYNTSGSINLVNRGLLSANHGLFRTTSNTGRINIQNFDKITFLEPFIEGVTSEEILTIGADGADFLQQSGGLVFVSNQGSITQKDTPLNTNSNLITYLLIIVIICIAVLILISLLQKKRKQ